jgi:NADPH:quinone reductase-like Zn-dependent oxidoreductase
MKDDGYITFHQEFFMTNCKAAYYQEIGSPEKVLKFKHFVLPNPQKNEVQVKILYSGINPSDVKIRQGLRGPLANIIEAHQAVENGNKIGQVLLQLD